MKRYLLLWMWAGLMAISAYSQGNQEPGKTFNIPGLFYGVNFAGAWGRSYKLLSVTPQAGYRFNKFVAAGGGITFLYTQTKYPQFNLLDVSHGFGLNLFARIYPIKHVFLNVQPEFNYMTGKRKYDYGNTTNLNSGFVPSILVGPGVSLPPLGKKGASIVMIQWDVLQRPGSAYDNNFSVVLGFNFQ